MNGWQRLRDVPTRILSKGLKNDGLRLDCGQCIYNIKGNQRYLLPFLRDQYRDYLVSNEHGLSHFELQLKAPNFIRQWIRPQVAPITPTKIPVIPLPLSMSALALEMGMNLFAALGLMRVMLLHAAVVSGPQGGVLISAASGGGKSTLAAGMMQWGYRLHSDEFGMVNANDGALRSFPRPVSLKNESIPIVSELAGVDWMSKTLRETPKGNIAYRRVRPDDIARYDETSHCKVIILPIFETGRRDKYIKELTPAEAAMRLIPSSTNYHHLGEDGYKALMTLVQGAKTYEIKYGSLQQSLDIMESLGFGPVGEVTDVIS